MRRGMNGKRLVICAMLGALVDFVPVAAAAARDGKSGGKLTAKAEKAGARSDVHAPSTKKPPADAQPQSHVAADESAEAESLSLVTLGVIDGEVADGQASINVRFDRRPDWPSPIVVEEHGSFLQLAMPGVIVPNPGKFIDTGVVAVPKIASFQTTPTDAALRLFVAKDAAAVKSVMQAAVLDKRLILTIDLAQLDAVVAAATTTAAGKEDAKSAGVRETAEAVIARTEVRDGGPPPAQLLQGNGAGAQDGGGALGSFDLRGKLVAVTLFLGALLGLALLSFMLRPWIRRKVKGVPELPVSMRMLGSLPLASRQKLSLIQVGDEKILVGVTPENVSFIASLPRQGSVSLPTGTSGAVATAPRPVARAADDAASFSRLLAARDQAVEMAPAPKLKDLPGNDEGSLRRPLSRELAAPRGGSADGERSPKPAGPRRPRSDASFARDEDEGGELAPARAGRFADADDERKSAAPRPSARSAAKTSGSRVNIAVGDDGARPLAPAGRVAQGGGRAGRKSESEPASSQAIDDVTKMIREKLKSLKSI